MILTPKKVFCYYKELEEIGLAASQVTYFMNEMKAAGYAVNTQATTVAEAKAEILRCLKRMG